MKQQQQQADAYPRKRFFLEMFTRDISLEECILDLIDNSVDSLIRHSKHDIIGTLLDLDAPAAKEPLPEITVVANAKVVSVVDECGGIANDDALHDVFCFGHKEGHTPGSLGVYGIGLKRAIFKIGNAFEMSSQTTKDAFSVKLNVNDWAKKDSKLEDWRIPIQTAMPTRDVNGTQIHFSDLRPEVKMRLKDGGLEASLQKSVSQAYSFFLEKHVRIKLNGKVVKPMAIPLGQSGEVKPARHKSQIDGVTMRFFAGLMDRDDYKHERAGWYVLCNGRVVLAADKTDITGWGALKLPTFHTKYNGFIGVALLQSKDSLKLPWTTTKRGLNRESEVYQHALREMVSLARPVLSWISRQYPKDLEESPIEREVAGRVKKVDLRELAGKPASASFEAKAKAKTKETVRVQYEADPSEIERVRKERKNPTLTPAQIGRLTFEYYLKVEC